jgi:uncharacterized membrane protein YdjX (TVP38/TMEM64 family)
VAGIDTGRKIFLAVVAAMIALALLSPAADWLTIESLRESRDMLAAFVAARPVVAGAGFFALCVVATACCFPAAPLIGLAGGALFGFWPGLAIVLAASSIGSTAAFFESRYLLRGWVRTRLSPRLAPIERGLERHGPAWLLALRWNPFVPYWLVNLMMGVTAMRARIYVPLTVIGLFPATLLYVTAGTELAALRSAADIASPGLIGALLLLSLLPIAAALIARRSAGGGTASLI